MEYLKFLEALAYGFLLPLALAFLVTTYSEIRKKRIYGNSVRLTDEEARLMVELLNKDLRRVLDEPKRSPIDELIAILCGNSHRKRRFRSIQRINNIKRKLWFSHQVK